MNCMDYYQFHPTETALLWHLNFKIMGKICTRSFSACLTFQSILFGDVLYFTVVERVLEMTELYLSASKTASSQGVFYISDREIK